MSTKGGGAGAALDKMRKYKGDFSTAEEKPQALICDGKNAARLWNVVRVRAALRYMARMTPQPILFPGSPEGWL